MVVQSLYSLSVVPSCGAQIPRLAIAGLTPAEYFFALAAFDKNGIFGIHISWGNKPRPHSLLEYPTPFRDRGPRPLQRTTYLTIETSRVFLVGCPNTFLPPTPHPKHLTNRAAVRSAEPLSRLATAASECSNRVALTQHAQAGCPCRVATSTNFHRKRNHLSPHAVARNKSARRIE